MKLSLVLAVDHLRVSISTKSKQEWRCRLSYCMKSKNIPKESNVHMTPTNKCQRDVDFNTHENSWTELVQMEAWTKIVHGCEGGAADVGDERR
jgi:hypothetical protein